MVKKCKVCGKEIPARQTYCSYQCRDEAKKKRDKKAKWNKQRGITNKKLDKLWANKVKERDGMCLYCETKNNLNAHHIFSRSNFSTRWLLENGISLCSKHHILSSEFSAHKTPVEFVDWLIELKGREFVDYLRVQKNKLNEKSKEEWWGYLNAN